MEYLKIHNWDDWQTYRKDRGRPPWIKVHLGLLQNLDFLRLDAKQRGELLTFWLIAAENEGRIPSDPEAIQLLGRLDFAPDLKHFIDHRFIDDANQVVTTCQPGGNQVVTTLAKCDATESDTEAEAEAETDKTLTSSQMTVCPYDKIVSLYHKTLPNHPTVRVLTKARKSAIKQRHVGDMEANLETWESYFKMVGRSDFLSGRSQPMNGRKVFIADLEWITKQGNFVKIYEGKYHGKI